MTEAAPHPTSLAVWGIPQAAATGEHFAVKVGVKSSAGCTLGGCRVEVLDGAGEVLARGQLGDSPWPGSDALYWSEIELRAPDAAGTAAFAARFDAAGLAEPHQDALQPFEVAVVPPPEHVLTVTVQDCGSPVSDAIVRAGPHRAITNAEGIARLHLAKGQYQLQVWRAGYDTEPLPLTVEAEASILVAARAQPEDDPDAHWKG